MLSPAPGSIKLWDIPVRLVHWSFVGLIPALWWTGEQGDLETHKSIGLVMLGLVLFRLIWGLIGSQTARFASFIKGPGAILSYLRGSSGSKPVLGHNPLGALSVVALIGVIGAQITSGLFAQDIDGIESGPLTYLVEYDTADWAREWHHLLFNILLALIVVHLLAIFYYRVIKRDNLIMPMITGRKYYDTAVAQPAIAGPLKWIPSLILAALGAYWVSKGAPLPWGG